MAIRRCPYCKAIIDESQKYCNNCGTQLLFPEEDPNEEPIKGERIVDEDFPGGTDIQFSDFSEEGHQETDDSDLGDGSEREEIDLEKILKGERLLPGEEKKEIGEEHGGGAQDFPDLKDARLESDERKPEEESLEIEIPDLSVEPDAPEVKIPERIESLPSAKPSPGRSRSRRKKAKISTLVQEEPLKPVEEEIRAEEAILEIPAEPEFTAAKETDSSLVTNFAREVLSLTPPVPIDAVPKHGSSGFDTKDEIARLIADFEKKRRVRPVEVEKDLVRTTNNDKPKDEEDKDPLSLGSDEDISVAAEIIKPSTDLEEALGSEEFRPKPWGEPGEEREIEAESDENPDDDRITEEDRDESDERPAFLADDLLDFQDEGMNKASSALSPRPTMGIPETVTKLQEALLSTSSVGEIEIEKELEAIASPVEPIERKDDYRIDDFETDKEVVRDDEDEIEDMDEDEDEDEADDGGEAADREEAEIPAVRHPIVRLGFFRRIKALLIDLAIVAVFWVGAAALAAAFLSVPILDLVAAAALPLGLLLIALSAVYLFLFLFLLGETPGGRLVTPKD